MRTVQRIPLRALDKIAKKAMQKWERGLPVFREMAVIRTWTTLEVFDNTIHDLNWMSDLTGDYTGNEVKERFARHYNMNQILPSAVEKPDADLMAAMTWSALKTLSHSDTPNWFRISEGLAHQLMVTELHEVQAKDVQVPYPGFYVELPPGLLWWLHQKTGWHEVRVISVAEGCPDKDSMHGYSEDKHWVLGRRLLIVVFCEPNEKSIDPSDDNVAYFALPLNVDNATVDELMIRDRAWAEENEKWKRDQNKIMVRFGGREMPLVEGRDLLRSFVINVLLYLGSEGAEVQHTHATKIAKLRKGKHAKRKKTKESIKRLQEDRIFDVGTTIGVDPEIKKYIHSGRRGPKFELKHRTLVRGHWRNQAHGKAFSLRKRVWIKPYVKKKDLPERVIGHNYEVE
jgi:hypothetical protein